MNSQSVPEDSEAGSDVDEEDSTEEEDSTSSDETQKEESDIDEDSDEAEETDEDDEKASSAALLGKKEKPAAKARRNTNEDINAEGNESAPLVAQGTKTQEPPSKQDRIIEVDKDFELEGIDVSDSDCSDESQGSEDFPLLFMYQKPFDSAAGPVTPWEASDQSEIDRLKAEVALVVAADKTKATEGHHPKEVVYSENSTTGRFRKVVLKHRQRDTQYAQSGVASKDNSSEAANTFDTRKYWVNIYHSGLSIALGLVAGLSLAFLLVLKRFEGYPAQFLYFYHPWAYNFSLAYCMLQNFFCIDAFYIVAFRSQMPDLAPDGSQDLVKTRWQRTRRCDLWLLRIMLLFQCIALILSGTMLQTSTFIAKWPLQWRIMANRWTYGDYEYAGQVFVFYDDNRDAATAGEIWAAWLYTDFEELGFVFVDPKMAVMPLVTGENVFLAWKRAAQGRAVLLVLAWGLFSVVVESQRYTDEIVIASGQEQKASKDAERWERRYHTVCPLLDDLGHEELEKVQQRQQDLLERTQRVLNLRYSDEVDDV